MPVPKPRLLVATATAALLVAALAAAPAAQAAVPPSGQPGPATAKVTNSHVIVLLKNQHAALTPKRGAGRTSQRARTFAADQAARGPHALTISARRTSGSTA